MNEQREKLARDMLEATEESAAGLRIKTQGLTKDTMIDIGEALYAFYQPKQQRADYLAVIGTGHTQGKQHG